MVKVVKNFRVFDVEPKDVSVDVKVQIDVVGSIIQEWIDRVQIEEIKKSHPVPVDDPAFG
jgi:hypothetical protein